MIQEGLGVFCCNSGVLALKKGKTGSGFSADDARCSRSLLMLSYDANVSSDTFHQGGSNAADYSATAEVCRDHRPRGLLAGVGVHVKNEGNWSRLHRARGTLNRIVY